MCLTCQLKREWCKKPSAVRLLKIGRPGAHFPKFQCDRVRACIEKRRDVFTLLERLRTACRQGRSVASEPPSSSLCHRKESRCKIEMGILEVAVDILEVPLHVDFQAECGCGHGSLLEAHCRSSCLLVPCCASTLTLMNAAGR